MTKENQFDTCQILCPQCLLPPKLEPTLVTICPNPMFAFMAAKSSFSFCSAIKSWLVLTLASYNNYFTPGLDVVLSNLILFTSTSIITGSCEVIFPSKLNYEFCARTLYFDTRIFCENAVLCKPVLCNTVLCNTVLWNTIL